MSHKVSINVVTYNQENLIADDRKSYRKTPLNFGVIT